MKNNKIEITQYPVISHQLKEAGKSVTKRIDELELDKQVATVDTVKSLKDLRAELNKEITDFENQRKFIKEGVNKPYLEFEELYKTEISEKYKTAIDLLKDKIAFVENKIKSDKKKSLESYFNELCVSEKIDFISFEKLGIDVNLSTTEKKYKEQINDYITKVIDDLNLIKSTDFEAEILTEYKLSLNVSKAITDVKTRKENEAKEAARIKAEQTSNRKKYLENLGLRFVEITNSFEFNADIHISVSEIENLSKEDFTAKYSEIQVKVLDVKAKEIEVVTSPEQSKTEPIINAPKVVSAPLQAPKVEEIEPIKTASFEVKATYSKLIALGKYMTDNGITYKNI